MLKRIAFLLIFLCIVLLCKAQQVDWLYGNGGWVQEYGYDVTYNKDGYAYITGDWDAAFISKIAPDGKHVWTRKLDDRDSYGAVVLTDSLGNVYLAGHYGSRFTIDGISIDQPYRSAVFIAKLSEDGDFLWVKAYDGLTRMAMVNDMEMDTAGNLYIGMNFEKQFILGDSVYSRSTSYNSTMLFIKLSGNGEFLDAWNPGSSSDDILHDLEIDSNGAVYFTGFTLASSLEFGDKSFNNPLSHAGFLGKYSKDFEIEWLHFFKAPYFSQSQSLTIDEKQDIAVTGFWSEGNHDSLMNHFVAKFDSNGNKLFHSVINSHDSRYEYPGALVGRKWDICSNGRDIYVTASLKVPIQMGNVNYQSDGNRHAIILKYNEIGYPQWILASEGNDEEKGFRITNSGEKLLVGGSYTSTNMNFGADEITNNSGNSNNDFFVFQAKDTTSNVCPEPGGLSLVSDSIICEGDSIVLSIKGDYAAYTEWYRNDTSLDIVNQKQIYLSDEGEYSVLINADTRCPETWLSTRVQHKSINDTSDIIIYPLPVSEIGGQDSVCLNDTLSLFNVEAADVEYLWEIHEAGYMSDNDSSVIDVMWETNPDSTLVTSLVTHTISSCRQSDTTYIHINPLPELWLRNQGDTILTILTSESLMYQWYYNTDSLLTIGYTNTYEIDTTGTYTVIAENLFGCRSERSLMVNTLPAIVGASKIQAPLVYPNPAGDLIRVRMNAIPESIEVFNMRGERVIWVENQDYIDVLHLPEGTYLLRSVSAGISYQSVFIKQR